MVRRGSKRKQLLDDLKAMRGYWQLKEEALDYTLWRTRFGRGCGPIVRQTTELIKWMGEWMTALMDVWMNEWMNECTMDYKQVNAKLFTNERYRHSEVTLWVYVWVYSNRQEKHKSTKKKTDKRSLSYKKPGISYALLLMTKCDFRVR